MTKSGKPKIKRKESREEYIERIRGEYTLIQQKIDNYGESSLKIKGFALTVVLAASYFAIREDSLLIPILGFVGILIFLYYETVNKAYYDMLKGRAYSLEMAITSPLLRRKIISPQIAHKLKSPNIITFYTILKLLRNGWQLSILYYFMMAIFLIIFIRNIYIPLLSTSNIVSKNFEGKSSYKQTLSMQKEQKVLQKQGGKENQINGKSRKSKR